MSYSEPDDKGLEIELRSAINGLAIKRDADIIIFNFEILPPIDIMFSDMVATRTRRKNVVLVLTTEGGSADAAFRIGRLLQEKYAEVTIVVPGWCKSAGTLISIAGHQLLIGDSGELGPLDVQIAKSDEMDEQKSGLVAEAAFEKLQQEAFKLFIGLVRDIGSSEYRVTLRTAAEIASKMTIGVLQPIFEKLDPITMGEDYRSNRLASAYAERLNLHSRNLRRTRQLDALANLLSSYPSHGFQIDRREAGNLFRNVKPIPDEMSCVMDLLGADARFPRSSSQDQAPRMEFLNDEFVPTPEGRAKDTTEAGPGPAGRAGREGRPGKLPSVASKGGNSHSKPEANGSDQS